MNDNSHPTIKPSGGTFKINDVRPINSAGLRDPVETPRERLGAVPVPKRETLNCVDRETARNRAEKLKEDISGLLKRFLAETGWRPKWMNLFQRESDEVRVESITIQSGDESTKV